MLERARRRLRKIRKKILGYVYPKVYPKHLDRKVVKSVVSEKYGLAVADIEALSDGIRNGVWLVKSEQGEWAAKVYATRSFKRIQNEVELYAYLLAHDINVPAVRPSVQGRLVEELVSGGYTYPLVVMRYEKLSYTTPSTITQPEMETIGKEIARAHTTLQRYPERHLLTPRDNRTGKPGSTSEYPGAYSRLAASFTAEFYTQSELRAVEQLDRRIVKHLNSHMIPPHLTKSVIHSDLGLRHVPFLPNGNVYIFDWHQKWHPVARDLGVLCMDLYVNEDISFSRWEELRAWLLSGYSSIMHLTRDDLQAIQTFTLKSILEEVSHHCRLSTRLEPNFREVKRSYQLASCLLEQVYCHSGF